MSLFTKGIEVRSIMFECTNPQKSATLPDLKQFSSSFPSLTEAEEQLDAIIKTLEGIPSLFFTIGDTIQGTGDTLMPRQL